MYILEPFSTEDLRGETAIMKLLLNAFLIAVEI
mgnify:CR=1 FL=1